MPPRAQRKSVNRSGRIISAAKALYGDTRESTSPEALKSPSLSQVVALAPPGLYPSSTSARLNTLEIKGLLVSDLLDTRYNPAFYETEVDLRSEFDAVGRQISTLDDQTQVLLASVAAVAARSSDHPFVDYCSHQRFGFTDILSLTRSLLIGNSPYRVADLENAMVSGIDLQEYGRRREAACNVLTQHALKLADEKRTLREATLESVSALMLLEGLQQTWDLTNSPRQPVTVSYLGHVRRMIEEVPTQHFQNNRDIAWTACRRRPSAHRGIHAARPSVSSVKSTDDWRRRVGLQASPKLDELFHSWMNTLATLAIRTTPNLSGGTHKVISSIRSVIIDASAHSASSKISPNQRTVCSGISPPAGRGEGGDSGARAQEHREVASSRAQQHGSEALWQELSYIEDDSGMSLEGASVQV
ncbi:hypothetical protein P7C70_g757, partial [Phenoliferia sp. Uapishka_3]